MAARTKNARARAAERAGDIAGSARTHPVVQRMVEDPDFRDDVRTAYDSLRLVYQRMSNGKGPYRALTEDKKVQKNLRRAAESIRDATDRLKSRPKRHRGRRLLILVTGLTLVFVFSEGARRALLDKLFGAEEEFEYTSTTTPA